MFGDWKHTVRWKVATAVLALAASHGVGQDSDAGAFAEEYLYPLPPLSEPDISAANWRLSPDGSRLAVLVNLKSGRQCLWLNGRQGPQCNSIHFPDNLFSPDGKKTAYVANINTKECVLLNNRSGPRFSRVNPSSLRFGSNGMNVCYIGEIGRIKQVVMNGQPGPEFEDIRRLQLGPGGHHLTYSGTPDRDGESGFVLDNRIISAKSINGRRERIVFSPDGRRYGYIALVKNPYNHIPNAFEEYRRRHKLSKAEAFRNKERIRAVISRSDGLFMVIDGFQDDRQFDLMGLPVFSPDSKRVAYWAAKDDQCRVIIDGREGRIYRWAATPVFSPDSRRVAYFAKRLDKTLCVVVDGEEFPSPPVGGGHADLQPRQSPSGIRRPYGG